MNFPAQDGPFSWMVFISLLTTAGAVGLAALLLTFSERARQRLMPHLLSFSVGTLMGTAFTGLLPHALGAAPVTRLFPMFLAGIIGFMVLERLMLWRHCHEGACEIHSTSGPLLLLGDAMHNFVDGILIAATFLTSIPLGITTSLAIMSHEVPQELGDFSILLHNGYSPKRSLALNGAVSAAKPIGALVAWVCLPYLQMAVPYVMVLASAGFVYVAMADLVPTLHRCARLPEHALQLALIVAGMLLVASFELVHRAH